MDSNSLNSVSVNASLHSFCVESPAIKQTKSRYASLISNRASDVSNVNLFNTSVQATPIKIDRSKAYTEHIIEPHHEVTFPCFTLFKAFLDCRKKLGDELDIFLLMKEYEEQCSDHLTVLLSLKHSHQGFDPKNRGPLTPKMEKLLRVERNSWRLMGAIFEDKLKNKDTIENEADEAMAVDGITKRMSDKDVIDMLFEKDLHIRTMQLVIDWLEKNERDDMDLEHYNDKIEFYSEGPHCWENTLHHIKNRISSNRAICSEMDPDAPIRLSADLHDLDKEDEGRLMKHIFRYIRAGRLENAKIIAEKFGYHWLSAALDGWILHHDFNFDEGLTEAGSIPISQGNANRDLWKYACFKYSEMKKNFQSIYEPAIFGVLSGNVKPALSLINRWSDRLWLLFRASLDVQIENELRHSSILNIVTARSTGKINYSRASIELPEDYWNNDNNFIGIFREVDALAKTDEMTVEEICHQTIQKCIILDDIDSALEFMVTWSREPHDEVIRSHILRFYAHSILFFSEMDLITNETRKNFSVVILEEYINYLINWKEIELVAAYVAHLPPPHQITTYSRLLETITDKTQRALCLKFAKEANLDIERITKKVVEMIRSLPIETKQELTPLPSDMALHTQEDRNKIDALDWLFIDEIQYIELLLQSNALLRQFILSFKKDAAKDTMKKLPSNLIDGAILCGRKKSGTKKALAKLENAIKEHQCHRAYISAIESFDEWMQFYHSFKPQQPKVPTSNRFTDKVAYQNALQEYEDDLKNWKKLLSQQAQFTTEKIYNVLWYTDTESNYKGWMIDQKDEVESEDSETRSEELSSLRKLVIPQLTFILHSVLHSSNLLKECLKIADLIASENFSLYKEFNVSQIQSLLHKLRETSTVLLDQYADCFGYL